MCKVFKHNDGNHSEERQQAVANDADGEFVEAMLLSMLEDEENNSGFQSLSNMSQVCAKALKVPFLGFLALTLLYLRVQVTPEFVLLRTSLCG